MFLFEWIKVLMHVTFPAEFKIKLIAGYQNIRRKQIYLCAIHPSAN